MRSASACKGCSVGEAIGDCTLGGILLAAHQSSADRGDALRLSVPVKLPAAGYVSCLPLDSNAVDTKGEEDALTTLWAAYFGEDAESLISRLQKGAEIYCEGRLRLDTWTAKDGLKRSGLSGVAWRIVPLGQIGRKRSEEDAISQDP